MERLSRRLVGNYGLKFPETKLVLVDTTVNQQRPKLDLDKVEVKDESVRIMATQGYQRMCIFTRTSKYLAAGRYKVDTVRLPTHHYRLLLSAEKSHEHELELRQHAHYVTSVDDVGRPLSEESRVVCTILIQDRQECSKVNLKIH